MGRGKVLSARVLPVIGERGSRAPHLDNARGWVGRRFWHCFLVALIATLCVFNLACSRGSDLPLSQGSTPPPPPTVTATISPTEVQGGQTATVTLNFSSAIPAGGVTAMLVTDNPQVLVLPNPTLSVAAGATNAMFTVTTTSVPNQTTVNIAASITTGSPPQTSMGSVALKVDPTTTSQVQSVVLGPPTTVQGGQSVNGTISLTTAPTGPAVVQLSSSLPSIASFASSSVSFAAGQTTGNFTVITSTVTSQMTVTITGTLNSPVSANLIVQPLQVSSLVISPGTVTGGQASTGTVILGGPAAAGGTAVALSSSNPGVTVPPSVTVPAGTTSASFAIRSSPVTVQTNVTITASLNGSQKIGTLTVNQPAVSSLMFDFFPLNASSGQMTTGTVTLNANAPAGGLNVNITSTNQNAFPVPASVFVAANTSIQTFMVTAGAVSTPTPVTVTASTGSIMVSVNIMVLPPPVVRVSFVPANVVGGNNSIGTVVISPAAPSGGVFVSLSSSDPNVILPTGVTVPAGSTSQTFTATTKPVSTSITATVSATSGSSLNITGTLTVIPPSLGGVSLNPNPVAGGMTSQGTVSLTGPAPTGGVTVTLTSSNMAVATVPVSVNVPAGSTSANFNVTTFPVIFSSDSNITATLAGNSLIADLTVNPPVVTMISFNPSIVASGQMSTGTVTLNGNAPTGGLTVTLSSSNSTAFPVQANVTVAAGMSSQTFTVTAGSVASSTPVTVMATTDQTMVMNNVTVVPSGTVSSLTLNPTTVTGGTSTTGTVTIGQAAPAGGIIVVLTSSDPSVTVANVTIPGGATMKTFTATTVGVATATNVTITASLGASMQTATLHVNPAAIMSLTLNPASVTGGTGSMGNLVLTGPAPPGGLTVGLMSNNTSAATVAVNFNIAGGASSGTFSITTLPVSANANVSITATLPSTTSTSSTLTVRAPVVTMLSFSPSTVVSGQMSTGTVVLSGLAPAGGISVGLMSSNTTAFPVQANVVVAANTLNQTFTVMPGAVGGSTPVTVTATTGTTNVTANVTVVPQATVMSVTFNPTSVTGGTSSTGTVTLGQAAPTGGITVTLTSGDPTVTVPGTIIVLATKTSQTFTATTIGVAMVKPVTVTATVSASSQMGTLTVNPASISSFTFNPNTVTGGTGSVGMVSLNGPAPAAGLTVSLMSSNMSAVTTPANFNIAGGATSGTFNVNSLPVASSTPVTITATLPSGTSGGGGVTVIPPVVTNPLSFSPSSVGSGQMTTGTVNLTGAAPAGGIMVSLSSNPSVTSLPSPVTVPANNTSQTFMVTAGTVNSVTPVVVTATTGTSSVMGTFTEMPVLTLSSLSASCTGMPETCSFPGTQISVASAAIPLILTNNTSSSVMIQSIAISGANPGDFNQTNNCPASLGGLASCTINVTFTPTQAGNRTATVTATSTSPASTASTDFMGTGFHWVNLTWTECAPGPMCPSVNNFNVYRIQVANGTGTCPATGYAKPTLNLSPIPYSATPSFQDLSVGAGNTYCYVVTAVNTGGESGFSAPTGPPVVIPSP